MMKFIKGKVYRRKMKEQYLRAFNAITEFIKELENAFPTEDINSLVMYRRVIDHIQFLNEMGIYKSIKGFKDFFDKYEDLVVNNELDKLPANEVIRYGDSGKVYLEIYKYIKDSDIETVATIRKHLIFISAILNPNGKSMTVLKAPKSLPESKENGFLSNIMNTAREVCEKEISTINTETTPAKDIDIMGIAAKIIGSDSFQHIFKSMQEGIASNRVNPYVLLNESKSMLTNMMNNENEPTIEEVPNLEEVD